MEFPHLGEQCSESKCTQLDYLPIKCKCELFFCSEHFPKHALKCPNVQVVNEPNLESAASVLVCSAPNCKSRSYVPLLCDKCNKHFCISHRHINECFQADWQAKAAELNKYTDPIEKFKEVKAEVDKQLDANLDHAKKKLKTSSVANKVQLMRIKNKAQGLSSIPTNERVYFNITFTRDTVEITLPIFISKLWSLGRAIDAIAERFKLLNKNNQSNAPKLQLFHKSNEAVIISEFSVQIELLLTQNLLSNGEDLLLKYVTDCV